MVFHTRTPKKVKFDTSDTEIVKFGEIVRQRRADSQFDVKIAEKYGKPTNCEKPER
jgi:hypothetical protein